jgi:hypothetical protein
MSSAIVKFERKLETPSDGGKELPAFDAVVENCKVVPRSY